MRTNPPMPFFRALLLILVGVLILILSNRSTSDVVRLLGLWIGVVMLIVGGSMGIYLRVTEHQAQVKKQPQINLITLELVKIFVERQQLVLAALLELRPGWPIMYRFNQFTNEEEQVKAVMQTLSNPPSGLWGDENQWQYGTHGGGCLLVHTITGEPLEWDAPEVDVFDRYWFGDWVRWYAKTNHIESLVDVDNDTIHQALLEMECKGLLGRGTPPIPARFRLITN
jgi:hypothetical protein